MRWLRSIVRARFSGPPGENLKGFKQTQMAVYRSENPGSASGPAAVIENGHSFAFQKRNNFAVIHTLFCVVLGQIPRACHCALVNAIRAMNKFPYPARNAGQK